ncbi:uncharacterized protein [Spinacia oleracea]|uniref:Uncharacterized protein isoform X1 n=1 Tax=Spinacia oleracea TaxID=3562 RepID=A0ABM3R514_SPIOL|nr:uncharacterized protein LOC130465928 isoform X1 [Spinacia oleracea]XP_056690696.1 uncharacterized protein LOC130465928 isoform X1 [Spinacia oleracea]
MMNKSPYCKQLQLNQQFRFKKMNRKSWTYQLRIKNLKDGRKNKRALKGRCAPEQSNRKKKCRSRAKKKTEEKKEEMKVDSLRFPTVTTHSNELGASSSGTKPIIEENEDRELEIAIQLAVANSLENIDSKDGSKKENKDEKSDTKEREEVLVETDNEETDDEHKEHNENIEREIPRSAPVWENVKK